MPGFPVLHYLLEQAKTHVHWVSDTTNLLILSFPLLLLPSIFLSIKVFSSESGLCISGQSIGASVSASVLPMNIQHAHTHKKNTSKMLTPTTIWMSFKNIILNNNKKNRYRKMSPGNILYASLYMKYSNGQSSSMMIEIRKQLPLWAGRQRSTGKGYEGNFRGDWKRFMSRPWLRW